MGKHILQRLESNIEKGIKSFAVLLDPDKLDQVTLLKTIQLAVECQVDFFFLGGSLLTRYQLPNIVRTIKDHSSIPVILFPGSNLQIEPTADALLFLSLISGRNPEFLIGQHVISAPIVRKSNLEVLPTGYILIDCGKPTTVSYVSNTTPIPYDKPAIAACTAMAGEMLGLKMMYLDGGSGAQQPVSRKMIATVRKSVQVPIIVGGGLNTPDKAVDALQAGADVVVVGNSIEDDPSLMIEMAERIREYNLEHKK
ncbi:MAG: geranylgeranylglyceryl/heptaprenylglyceryl phosphate synthase [Cytophagaceae bacterium]|jgi:putative glycerol-1-phosphate prenyltransferase|nr:geranylgeranylglyceryl/heptaprenylglyceryl phosphate synthase [Cytophagaceae bacterium]